MKPKISEINITPIRPVDGLVAFASFVLEDSLYCGAVGIVTRLNGGYRLVYPKRQVGDRQLDVFYPISKSVGLRIEDVVIKKYEEVLNHGRDRHSDFNPKG